MSFDPLTDESQLSSGLLASLETYKLSTPTPVEVAVAELPGRGFLERCAAAALAGRDIAKLRTLPKTNMVLDRGVLDYLTQLAGEAKVQLERLLAGRGLGQVPTSPEFAAAWGQLACQIGLPIKTACDLLRWSILRILHPDLMPMQALYRQSTERSGLSAPTTLDELLPEVSPVNSALLANCQAAFEAAYHQHDET